MGCVAALLAAGIGWALAAGPGSGGGAPAAPQGAPNSGSVVKGAGDTPQREVSVQPSVAAPGQKPTP